MIFVKAPVRRLTTGADLLDGDALKCRFWCSDFIFMKHPDELAILLVNDRVSSQYTIRISLFFPFSLLHRPPVNEGSRLQCADKRPHSFRQQSLHSGRCATHDPIWPGRYSCEESCSLAHRFLFCFFVFLKTWRSGRKLNLQKHSFFFSGDALKQKSIQIVAKVCRDRAQTRVYRCD